jgi:hypothetical protein
MYRNPECWILDSNSYPLFISSTVPPLYIKLFLQLSLSPYEHLTTTTPLSVIPSSAIQFLKFTLVNYISPPLDNIIAAYFYLISLKSTFSNRISDSVSAP